MDVDPNQLVFAIHGPDKGSDDIDASVFAQKLSQIIAAIKAADISVNGKNMHQYVIKKLRSSTPTVFIQERIIKRQGILADYRKSGIDAFGRCARAIVSGDKAQATQYGETLPRIERLASGAKNKKYSYAEIYAGNAEIIRLDEFLHYRAASLVRAIDETVTSAEDGQRHWFSGCVRGTFDGSLKAVDLRGAAPECVLHVSDNAFITCIFDEEMLRSISSALDKRVRLTGKAIYDKSSPVPIRFEIDKIELIKTTTNMLKWRKAFSPFELSVWEEDNP